ncbi:MAG TPA: hypothetical protein VEU33_37865 [Archangium sp.]|nr:hypothetical protein [Archangium sp.]
MHDSGLKRWVMWGALVSASWLVSACQSAQQPGNTYEVAPGFTRSPEQTGYNGTIRDIPTSIDPRTPEAQGNMGRSLLLDPGERALLESQGGAMGGSGSTPPAPGPEGGPINDTLGAQGNAITPSNEVPAAQSVGNDRPTNPNSPGGAPAKRDSRGR